jgi:hypothetical protein
VGFIERSKLVTTNHYIAANSLHFLKNTRAHDKAMIAMSSLIIAWIQFLLDITRLWLLTVEVL